jgi:molybdopterin-containing oxidoreductase family membrane subunit
MLVVTSLYKDWMVSSYGHFAPTFWDWSVFAGMGGVFLVPFLLFVRFLPVISASETKEEEHEEVEHG